MAYLLSEIVVIICFIALIVVLFDEKKDYLVYSFLIVVVAGLFSALGLEEARELENYVLAIHWDVIFFLICMFAIVEILKEALFFHYIAKKIVEKYRDNIRKMFWIICLISTISASIIEDLSVAMIFIPIILETCKEIKINPKPFLLGMTICINLAATLTPFGSAQNVMIASYFGKSLLFFLKYVSIYFVLGTFLTLVLLDKFILKKYTNEEWAQHCEDDSLSHPKGKGNVPEPIPLSEINPNPKVIKRNSIALGIFIVLLVIIPELYLAGLIGMLIFVFINPMKYKDGKNRPNVSNIFRKVDYKLIYFFICLFILVYLMELNGFILLIERMLENLGVEGVFGLSVIVLLLTSLLSGLIDNAPVTVVFLPIIQLFINNHPNFEIPFIIAMILGINLGGNFLPQGSAADMMTLELSEKYCVYDLNYKVLVKNGGLFALFHVVLGIVYLAFIIYVFPI